MNRLLRKHGYLIFGADPESIETVLKNNEGKEFVFKEGEGWWFKNPSKHHLQLPLQDRVELAVIGILTRKVASFNDVLQDIYLNFENALTPSGTSVATILKEYAIQTKSGWALRATIRKQERDHSKMQAFLSEIGRRLGYKVWVGLREKADQFQGEPLSDWSDLQELRLEGVSSEEMSFLRQIDLLWLTSKNVIAYAFEIEYTTAITEAFNRCSNIPKYHKTTRVIVLPQERENLLAKKANSELLRDRVSSEDWNVLFFDNLETYHNSMGRKSEMTEDGFRELMKRIPTEPRKDITLDSYSAS